MSQSSIHDYYSTVKRRPVDAVKELANKSLVNITDTIDQNVETSFKVPTTPVLKSKKSSTKERRETQSESSHLNKKQSKSSALAACSSVESNDRNSILKWTKRTINSNESSSESKKKRVQDAILSKNKDQTNDDRSTTSDVHTSPSKSTVKKRLFDVAPTSELDKIREKLREKINSNTDSNFLKKLQDFKEKTASPIKLNLTNLNSPTKILQEREERRAKAKELIELSPQKFLQQKLAQSPVKSPTRARILDGLNLPNKYKVLIDSFHCLDSVVSMLFNRQEMCTFDKVKCGIQKITKKNFDLSHLAQILTVHPDCYSLSYAKKTAVENMNNLKVLNKQSIFYLVLLPKINSIKLTPTLLKSRKDEFESRLNKYARKIHNDFLISLEPPVVIGDDELTRWHPSFIFPNIPEARLPEQPTSISETKSLNDFWTKKLNIESPQIDVKSAVTKVANEQVVKNKISKGILKGLSQEFLDKIKNKEAANIAREMTRKPDVEKKISEIKKLPELVRIVHSLFTTEKKKAILMPQVIKKCSESSISFSSGTCSDLIHLINELLPDWLLILKTSQGVFVKINKDTVLKSLYDRLDRCIIKLKEKS